MKNMRVALFTDSFDFFHDYTDGVAVIAQQFAAYASSRKLQLEIFTNGDRDLDMQSSETVWIHHFKPKIPWYLFKYFEMPLDLRIPNPRLVEIFDRGAFDVVHFTQPCVMGGNALFVAGRPLPRFPLTLPLIMANIDFKLMNRQRRKKLPLIGSFHTNVPDFVHARTGSRFLKNRFKEMLNRVYQSCDMVLATSHATIEEISRYIDCHNFDLFRSGVDTQAFHPRHRSQTYRDRLPGQIVLLYVGRVTPEKNIKLLRDVYLALCRRYPKIHLSVVGDGESLGWLQRELGPRVTTSGMLYGSDLHRAFASSDIFVFPSSTDTLGLVVLEAQAAGLPVVVTDCGGPREIVKDGCTGFVCRAGRLDDFVDRLDLLIRDPMRRRQMGQAARRLAELFSWERAFDQLVKVYERAIVDD